MTFFFSPYVIQEAIDYYDPDIVIYEKGERQTDIIAESLKSSLSEMR